MTMSDKIDAAALTRWILESARIIMANQEALSELDASTGDADHGSNMARGFTAVVTAVEATSSADPSTLLKDVGMTLVDTIGGSSGALYGTFFLRMARAIGGACTLDADAFADALQAGAGGIAERGNVAVGDKTMYDALAPAVATLRSQVSAGHPLSECLNAAATAAEAGRDSTAQMVARKGRSSYMGDRALGHVDAGSVSMALIIRAAAVTLPAA
jgi:dihydroxyacetone kinase-like protein